LCDFLKSLGWSGAQTVDASTGPWHEQLTKVLPGLSVLSQKPIPPADIESVLNGIVSLLVEMPQSAMPNTVDLFCKAVCSLNLKLALAGGAQAEDAKQQQQQQQQQVANVAPSVREAAAACKVSPLQNLFRILPENSPLRYTVYLALVETASEEKRMNQVVTDRVQLRNWMSDWQCSPEDRKTLWRRLHSALTRSGDTASANACLIDLMDAYTEQDASKARDEAIMCIVATLSDDSVYIMDHLLSLKPIQFLEGELIHELLMIFVSGSLTDYLTFADKNADFVRGLNICAESCMNKLRLLTLMRLAENKLELDYALLQDELKMESDDLEEFIIDAARKEAVFCKLDEVQRKVLVYGTTHRTFGRAQWTSLRHTLQQWHDNLQEVQTKLQVLAPGELDEIPSTTGQPSTAVSS
ncbi:hypothetical protein BOX15_Mlig030196g1, partial [Macrostomum lignano]